MAQAEVMAESPHPEPARPCRICGSTDWWWRQNRWAPKGEWLCNQCHPNPNKEVEMITERQSEVFTVSNKSPDDSPYHAPYYLADGSIVPSVTQVLNVLSKGEGMQYWAWNLGRQGFDYREIRDASARVGTLTHHLIACHLNCVEPSASNYPTDEIDKAGKCFRKYLAWEKENPLTPVIIEEPFVSEEYKYGGTPDLLAEINGEFVLLDFKTGNGIYDSYFCQLAAYRHLLEEQGWPVAGAWILRISPNDDQYEVGIQFDFDRDWEIFQHALAIYTLQGGSQ